MMISPSLSIRLFGRIDLAYDHTPLPTPRASTTRSLLAYLAVHHGRPFPRDVLAGTFWPNRPDAHARRALSNALWQIRRALGPAAGRLVAEGDTVTLVLHPGDRLDVAEFERAMATGQEVSAGDKSLIPDPRALTAAVTLYRAAFLEGCYDDWALLERERLRELYLAALERLITLHKRQGAYQQALDHALRLAAADPLREEAHRELMRLYHLLGRDRAALRQYDTLCRLLADELGGEPTAATTALSREIAARAGEAAPPYLPVAARPAPLFDRPELVPLVGRGEERAALLAHLAAAIDGRGGLVLVEGEAGVGKTRLLQEIARGAEWRGVPVGWGRSREVATVPPYGMLREALSAVLSPLRADQLAGLLDGVWLRAASQLWPQLAEWLSGLPPHVALPSEQDQERLREALRRLIVTLGQIAPHLLLLEDIQWAGGASLTALDDLAPHLKASRVLIIASCRSEEARARPRLWETLQALERAGCERLELGRLTATETGELVRRGLGLAAGAPLFEERLYRETEGNPLFVLETLRALHDEGLLRRDPAGHWATPWDETTADYAELSLPAGVSQVIARRLAHLEADERAVLNVAAVLEADFDFGLLARAGDLGRSAVLEAVGGLLRRRLLVEEPAAYRFSHDKVRQVAYTGIEEAERRRLHRQAGRALEALHPEQVERLAHHFGLGQVWDQAVHYHWRAGEHAAVVHAHPAALTHYDRAVALADAAHLPDPQRFELLAAREATSNVLGRREEQAADLETMARLAQDDPRRLVQVYQRRSWLLVRTSRFAEAEAMAHRALALARQLGDEAHQAAALTVLGTAIYQRGDMLQAIPTLETAIALYRRLGDPRGEAEAHRASASAFHGMSAYTAAHEAATMALTLYEALDDKVGQAEVLSLFGTLQMEQGESEEAIACYRQALEICHTIGYRYAQAKCWTNLGNVYYFRGQIAETLRCYDEAIAIFTSIGERRGEAFVRANAATVRHVISGDDETAARDAEAALALYAQAGDQAGEGQCLDTLGGIALRRGELTTARKQLEAALAAMQAAGDRWGEISVHRSLVALALGEGHPQAALEHLETATALCQELGLTDRAVALQADRGDVLLALSRPEAALTATAEAMAHLKPGVEQAYLIPFVHYQVLTALGRRGEAHAAIEQAHQMLSKALKGLSPEQQKMSLERVPEHRAIVAAWEATQPRQVTFRLPRAEAPTGRPLRDDEWVEVAWTVASPEDAAIPGKAWPERSRRVARRRQRILRLLREAGEAGAAPTVEALAAALDVGVRTIKRDLAALRAAGHDVRTRGSRNMQDVKT